MSTDLRAAGHAEGRDAAGTRSWLLAISIGPVQPFIGAARRTRDLWAGSVILATIARKVAEHLAEIEGVSLVFPAQAKSGDDEAIVPRSARVSNHILAEVSIRSVGGSTAPSPSAALASIADGAVHAARDAWSRIAERSRLKVASDIDQPIWEMQVDEVLELFASWAAIEAGDSGYRDARRRVNATLAARKSLRDFAAAPRYGAPAAAHPSDRLPKSSLDGAHESVLQGADQPPSERRRSRKLALSRGEELDAVGTVKRVAFVDQRFPSVSHLAADSWLEGIELACDADPEIGNPKVAACWKGLLSAASAIEPLRLAGGKSAAACVERFPFDGSLLYESQIPALKQDLDAANAPKLDGQFDAYRNQLRALSKLAGEPWPYLAIVAADGDGMGSNLDRLDSAALHREGSSSIRGFGDTAETLVKEHRGVLVYCGGDDLLALMPADCALACAGRINEAFRAAVAGVGVPKFAPTISMGVAIVHCREDLGDMRAFADEALRRAKRHSDRTRRDRDSIAISYRARGGAATTVVSKWDEAISLSAGILALPQRLLHFARLMDSGDLSVKAAHDLAGLRELYVGCTWSHGDRRAALRAEAALVLGKKAAASKSRGIPDVLALLDLSESPGRIDPGDSGADHGDLVTQRIDELVIASKLVEPLRQRCGARWRRDGAARAHQGGAP